jgi:hypothetical protein
MKNSGLSPIEMDMPNFNFEELQDHSTTARLNIASAKSADDVKTQICNIWSKIGKYVKLAEAVPVIGKFIKILAELLDSVCSPV